MDILFRVKKQFLQRLDSLELPRNPVVIFDIDGTLIDYQGFPIIPIVDLYSEILERGIHVGIITARRHTDQEKTLRILEKHGIRDYTFLYLMNYEVIQDPARYKLEARFDIFSKGFYPIMSIGDMPWDIGMYGGIGYNIPSYHPSDNLFMQRPN